MTGTMSFEEFCEQLKCDGAYIGDDWHIHRTDGKLLSRQCRNKYYMLRKNYGGKEYNFMEHRVIWYFLNGSIPAGLQINHKDFDRTNNNIDNLELMTAKDNLNYSLDAGRGNPPRAEKSGKAIFSNRDAQAMRWLKKHGWGYREITKLFGGKSEYSVGRIIRGTRYGSVPDVDDTCIVYPTIVSKTKRNISPDVILDELKTDMDTLVGIVDNGDAQSILGKVGDIICNITFLGNSVGIEMSDMLSKVEVRT